MNRSSFVRPVLALALAVVAVAPARAQALRTEYEGATALGLEMRRLGTTKRVLMIGAHPDDERTEILTALALGSGAEVAYLSLTRGEGGQNVIGPELQEGLGLIRTQELLAARRVDGARQFFTRAIDFGFSKNAEDTYQHWPHDAVLGDVVATIRAYRPDLVVAVFSGTPADGHGQHQVSGLLAREAFAAAGDPRRYPEQVAAGLEPFSPARLYQGGWRDGEGGPAVELDVGSVDPLLGRSYAQVAGLSRSRHRSQGFGDAAGRTGPQTVSMHLIQGAAAPGSSPFSGVDTTFSARAAALRGASAADASRARALLSDYESRVAGLARSFDPARPGALVPGLAQALRSLVSADSLLARAGEGAAELRGLLAAERSEAEDALWRAQGLALDAVAEDEAVVPGQEFTLTLSLRNGGSRPVRLQAFEPRLPAGWTARAADPLPAQLAAGALVTRRFRVAVPAGAAPTEPYFLRSPRRGDMYVWPAGVRVGVPFEPAPVQALARVVVEGAVAAREEEAAHHEPGAAAKEPLRTVRVVPPASVLLDPALAVVPLRAGAGSPGPLALTLRLRAEAPGGVAGTLRLQAPRGWRLQPESVPLRLAAGETREVQVAATPPASLAPGDLSLAARFESGAGASFTRGYTLIDYPHIRPEPLYRPAEARVRAFDVQVPRGIRVGYVAGVGDDVPQVLRQLGVEVDELDAAELASADLGRFDAVVTGIRAYEVRPDLVQHNARLLDYVKKGGTLVAQYNRFERTSAPIAPYPLTARLQDRVTVESAPVRLLQPDHPALSWPNRITAADFAGWVQERGLYFPRDIDPHFTPLLEMADPGEAPQRGALLVAPYGEGTYVYTGLALFRQFPEGVPGAYRLLANLISLGSKP